MAAKIIIHSCKASNIIIIIIYFLTSKLVQLLSNNQIDRLKVNLFTTFYALFIVKLLSGLSLGCSQKLRSIMAAVFLSEHLFKLTFPDKAFFTNIKILSFEKILFK